jgi:pyruvate kinase
MKSFRKTKIVCTIGPSSWDYKTLKELARTGMDVARLNMSHGTQEEKFRQIKDIRQIAQEIGKQIMVFADLQGPKLRLGSIEGEYICERGKEINLTLNPVNDSELPMQFDLSPYVKKGQRIFLNDGLVELKVIEVLGKTIRTEAQNHGVVTSHKGVNVPDTLVREGVFTQKDEEDAIFALKAGVDYLALSFVQTAHDLKRAKELIAQYNPKTKIIVKIEKKEAINNLEAIIRESDAVMVARGDLAIETDNTMVPILQLRILQMARQLNRPVIVATQMLESMIENPRPTRAEVSDVANAVIDQADAVMLSAESASGKYPVEAVETMRNIITEIERHPEQKNYININWSEKLSQHDLDMKAIASSACYLTDRMGAKAIVAGTASGKTVRLVSSFRPNVKIVAIAHDQTTVNQLNLVWGVEPILVKPTVNFNTFTDHIMDALRERHSFVKGDKIVFVTGMAAGVSGTTNTIKIATYIK